MSSFGDMGVVGDVFGAVAVVALALGAVAELQGGVIGIGAALLDYAVRELGVTRLWALEKNTRAIAFYQRHGFVFNGNKKFEEETDEYLLEMIR